MYRYFLTPLKLTETKFVNFGSKSKAKSVGTLCLDFNNQFSASNIKKTQVCKGI